MSTHPTVLVIGGTAGTGKSTIGESLVNLLRLKYPNACCYALRLQLLFLRLAGLPWNRQREPECSYIVVTYGMPPLHESC